MLQSPLLNPDKKSGEASRTSASPCSTRSAATIRSWPGIYVYQTQRASDVGAPTQDDIKIGDIAAISATILVGERDSVEGGSHKKVYIVDLRGRRTSRRTTTSTAGPSSRPATPI